MRAQRGGEQRLAVVGVGGDEAAAGLGQADVALLQHGEAAAVCSVSPSGSRSSASSCSAAGQRRQVGAAVDRARPPASPSGRPSGWCRRACSGVAWPAAPPRRARRRRRARGGGSSARRCRPPSGGRPGPGGCADAGTAPRSSLRDAAGIGRRTPGCGRTSAPPPRCCASPSAPTSPAACPRTTGRSGRCAAFSAVSTSSALNGSSISSRSGCTTSARARPTRWRMPPDSSFG